MKLIRIRQFSFTLIAYTVVFLTFQSKENIILTGIKIMLSVLINVGQVTQFQRMNRELVGILLFPVERVFQFRQPFHTFITKAVCHIPPSKQMGIKPSRCHTPSTHTHTFQRITANRGVHHTYIE